MRRGWFIFRGPVLALVLSLAISACSGPQFAIGAGTPYCTPTRVVDGKVVDKTTGEPFSWTLRRKNAGASPIISLSWSEGRRLKAKFCDGKRSYVVRSEMRVCVGASGEVVSVEPREGGDSPEMDERIATRIAEFRFCPFPDGAPQEPKCKNQGFSLRVPCDD